MKMATLTLMKGQSTGIRSLGNIRMARRAFQMKYQNETNNGGPQFQTSSRLASMT